jgi:hypothetical protein
MTWKPGTIVRSIHTGKRVRVEGPGQHEGTFAGECIGTAPQFSYRWTAWECISFVEESPT